MCVSEMDTPIGNCQIRGNICLLIAATDISSRSVCSESTETSTKKAPQEQDPELLEEKASDVQY